MAKKAKTIPTDLQLWIDAGRRHKLSHAHIQMARELGLNPKKFRSIDNHRQELWKMPLPDFIAHLYRKRTGDERPAVVRTMEEVAAARVAKKVARKQRRQRQAAAAPPPAPTPASAAGDAERPDAQRDAEL